MRGRGWYDHCMMKLADRLALLALIDARYYNAACDMIITHADDLTPDDADAIMTHARALDPAESDHAALIRDTLRDNTELTI